jgi:hypothetical protein
MCDSTLESKSGEATKNINEMLSVNADENVNIIIQTGGTSNWSTTGISATNADRYKIENKKLVLIERSAENQNFGESQTLTDFVNFGLTNYPAGHTALILWDHGGGSVKGVCLDENYDNDFLTLPELGTALKDADIKTKFDFIGFDACLMATYETASVLSPYANYMLASEEKEPSGGWNYTTLMTKLGSNSFYDDMLSAYAEKSKKKEYYTLSYFDLNGMAEVDKMLSQLIDEMSALGKRDVVNAINSAMTFGLSGSGLFDLGNLFTYFDIDGDYTNYVSSVSSELRSGATGLSIYFPLYDESGLSNYLTVSQNEKYNNFLTDFATNNGETINFVNYAQVVDNKLTFTIDPDSMANFAEAEYVLFSFNDDEYSSKAYLLGIDNDTTVIGNKITISFEGRWVEFGGKLLCCTILDEYDGYTIYQAPVMVNDEDATLLFGYSPKTKKTNVIGIIFDGDENGRVYSLDDGDMVLIIGKEYSEEDYTKLYLNDNEFEYSGQTINVVTLPDGIYQYSAFVKDIHGNTYTAGTAVVEIKGGEVQMLYAVADEVVYPPID